MARDISVDFGVPNLGQVWYQLIASTGALVGARVGTATKLNERGLFLKTAVDTTGAVAVEWDTGIPAAEVWQVTMPGGNVPDGGDYVEAPDASQTITIWLETPGTPVGAPGANATEIQVNIPDPYVLGDLAIAYANAINGAGVGWSAVAVDDVVTVTNTTTGIRVDPTETVVGVSLSPTVTVQGTGDTYYATNVFEAETLSAGDLAAIVAAVRVELAVELGRIDATISSRGTGVALTAANVRTAVGLATANLDTQLATILAAVEAGALTGPSTVTLTFVDQGSAVVPGVVFALNGVGIGVANGSGVATFGAANGNYTVTPFPTAGVLFTPTALVVAGATAQTITGQYVMPALPTPAADPFCDLTMDFSYVSGLPAPGGKLYAKLLVPGNAAARLASGFVMFDVESDATSDGTGRATLRVVRNSAFTTSGTRWLVWSSAPGYPPTPLTLTTGAYDCGTVVI